MFKHRTPTVTGLFSIIIAIFLPCIGFGQNFNSGLKIGFNATQVDGDNMAGFNHLGGTGGLFVNYMTEQNYDLGFEIIYSAKGSQRVVSPTQVDSGRWNKLTLHYMEVPLLFSYHINNIDKKLDNKLVFQGGLCIAYLFGKRYIDNTGSTIRTQDIDFVKKIDFSWTVGAYYLMNTHFSLFLRYTNSILTIGKGNSNYLNYLYDIGLTNQVASFGLQYQFNAAKSVEKTKS